MMPMKAILVAPPWDVADMMAVMKKDMSGTLHSNAELSRCQSCLAAAVKARERSTSLSLAADLASNVSSVLLMLPLPAKTDKGEVLLCFRYCVEGCTCMSLTAWLDHPGLQSVIQLHGLPCMYRKPHVLGSEQHPYGTSQRTKACVALEG